MKESHRQNLLSKLPKYSIGAEIGVHKGDFSRSILYTLQPREMHLVDPWLYETDDTYQNAWYGGRSSGQDEMDRRYASILAQFKHLIEEGTVSVHRQPSDVALTKFKDHYFDWVYIDGNHLFDYVLTDLELAYAKVKKGGFICGDDYEEGGWWQGGVLKAVDTFCSQKELRAVIVGNQFLIINQ